MVVNTFHDEGTIIGNVGTVEVVTNDRMTAPSAGEFSSICGQVMAIIENINRSDPDRVIVDMIKENRITLQRPSDALRDNVIKVLSAESKESAAAYLNTLPSDQATAIIEELKMLQRADATASSREAVPFLSQHQLTSLAVANMPQASFVAASAGQLAAPVAAETHNNAASIVVRNNAAAMRVFEFVRGTGIAALDGTASDRGARLELINRSMENRGVNLNLEALFGNMDQAVLDEATSVYSPAAYLVDLLEYLRSNNLDSKDLKADVTTSGQAPDLRGTALEHLLRRRPDLGDLELSPENTNTKLPYVDIANEVMESFITHLETYSNSSHEPRQAVIEVRNVRSETSAELLSQPQFIKREAYRKLSMANYPMTLPYNQPLDAQRVFLNFLKIKRADLIDYFRPKPPKAIRTAFQKDQVTEAPKNLRALQDTAISYAVDSETLGLAQEEYHILTKNTFWPREFLQMFQDKPLTEDEYHRAIGLPETHDLWGYDTDEQLQATDPSTKTGLQFTKTQLLPRSGLLYADLIDILQTGSINPAIPTGKSSTIFTRIRQSYRFLKSLVDATQTTCDKRFGLLVEFLQRTTAGLFTADQGIDDAVIRSWAVSQFEPAGNIIVLDNAAGGFRLSLSGFLLAINTAPGPDARDMSDMTKPNRDLATHGRVVDGDGVEYKSGVIGSLLPDGSIRDRNGAQMGQVLFDGVVCCGRSPRWVNIDEQFPKLIFLVIPETLVRDPVGVVKGHRLYHAMTADCPQDEVQWQSVAGQTGSASLGNMRLVHLDGTVLTVDEWDKLYCFIRIWRKTGWSVSDIDRALIGLTPRIDSALVGDWTSPMVDSSPVGDWPSTRVEANIDCDLIAELAAVKKLLSLSKLSVEELITFWAPISSRGPSSLYRRLFFSRRVGELDAVFQPDSNGDFFTRLPATISAHRLAISAAFSIRSLQDIDFLITENSVPDQLNLDTLSAIYRRALLSKVLQVGIRDLGQVILCFGNPFKSARECLRVLQRWNRIVGSGFTWAELRYTCDAAAQNSLADDILTPTTAETLDISRDISIGILDIQKRYPLVAKPEDATLELIKETASVLFDKEVVAGIVSLLDGTRTYTVSVPKVENPHFADSVATLLPERRKAQYVLPRKWVNGRLQSGGSARLQFNGILTEKEADALRNVINRAAEAPTNAPPATSNSLSSPKANSPATANDKTKWEMAVSRACSQATAFFFDHLSGFLPPELRDILTAPDKQEEDIHYPVSDGTDSKTAQEKAYEFLRHFIPKLQEKLTHEFLVKTITARAGFDDEKVVQLLLDTNMQAASGTTTNQSPAAFILDNLGIDPDRWRGYFFPQVSGNVKFVVLLDSVEQPNPLVIDDKPLPFSCRPAEQRPGWETPFFEFDPERIYLLQAPTAVKEHLQWTTTSLAVPIPATAFQAWRGFVSAPTTDSYVLSVSSDMKPHPIQINQQSYDFFQAQEDPEVIWATMNRVPFKVGEVNTIEMRGILPSELWWKPDRGSREPLPDRAYFAAFAHDRLHALVDRLKKLAVVLKHVKLSEREVKYISGHASDFGGMEFDRLRDLGQLERLYDLVELRDSVAATSARSDFGVLDLFQWMNGREKATAAVITSQICRATGWRVDQVSQVLEEANFCEGIVSEFRDADVLLKMQKVIKTSNELGADISHLFRWASPLRIGDFDGYADIAENIQETARAKFGWASWTDAVRPLNNTLRENQRKALVDYLLVQEPFASANNIVDADGLFEFFLIDVQMTPLVETSRIKQAISSVQLFVQRVLLGLEKDAGVPAEALDACRWEWMSKYRVWEANRKVFLYPENWIEPSLRDDKTEFFRQLESQLLQKDLAPETIKAAMQQYLHAVDTVSNLQCIGLYVEAGPPKKIHVFARTSSAPFRYFYNCFQFADDTAGEWRGWETMQVDIPSYEVGNTGIVGNYIAPIVYEGRLLVFMAQLVKTPHALPTTDSAATFKSMGDLPIASQQPTAGWEIRLGWTEYRAGQWTPRQLCSKSCVHPPLNVEEYVQVLSMRERAREGVGRTLDAAVNARRAYDFVIGHSHLPSGTTTVSQYAAVIKATAAIDTARKNLQRTEAAVSPDRSAPIDAFTLIPTAGPLGTGDSSSGGLRIYMEYYFSAAAFGLVAGNWFFNGSQLSHEAHTGEVTQLTEAPSPASFGVTMLPDGSENRVISYQARLDAGPQLGTWAILKQHDMADAFAVDDTGRTSHVANRILGLPGPMLSRGPAVKEPFFFDRAADLLQAANRTTDPQKIFDTLSSFDVEAERSVFGGLDGSAAYGRPRFDERGTLSSIYTWELGLHAPMALIDHLFKSQQYEQALRACHYVFDPLRGGDSDDVHRFWVFPPFRYMGPDTIEEYLMQLKAANRVPLISRWRDTPLQPHLVARDRPQAYMKWIVMKYIEILIEYGDSLFRQNTLESIPSAIQLYVLASHLYGPRGQVVPQRRSTKRWTYNMLVTGFDAFSNVIVQFEEALPFSTQTPPSSADAVAVMPFVNVFGSVGSLMFAIPDNPQLRALADKIDDRLFKIRHSQDINGGLRQLPLFEPPIYPGLLVQAAAQGLSLGSVMVGLNGPMYNHRFPYLLQKALDMANEVRYLGQALLGAREKADAEALSVLRAQQDLAIQNSLMEIKKLALDDAAKSIDTLQQSRRGIASRLRYYLALISSDATSGVPEIDQDFVELEAKIEKPVAEGGLALSRYESEEFDALEAARGLGTAMAAIETTSAILYALPSPTLSAQPLGVGIQVNAGPSCLAAATSAAARVLSFLQDQRNFEASMASRKGQHQRALQERVLQANAAGYEITGIDKQITAAKIRMAIAQKEIAAQQQTMTQNNELFDFLRQKYSNKDLYAYLDGATRVLFHSAYTQALTLALQAQQVYTFERPSAASQKPIVDASYWGDPSRDGLMSGERLSLALRQLEQAYTSTRGHDYEVIKPTSLRRLDPLALITLRETGTCDFSIPEILYDMDFPGHYMRRIKSVTLVIPCLVGPYASVNATLKLRASRLRVNPSLAGGYVESLSSDQEIDPRFITAAVPISAIAVSSGAGDAGVFELNFHDEGYMPMEGAGAISEWTLSLPSVEEVRPFEYETIGDVVLQVRYTSVEGGEALKKAAADAVRSYVRASDFVGMSGGLVAVFDVRNEFGTAWVRAGADGRAAAVAMPDLNERLPANTRRRRPEEIVATEVWVLTDAELPGGRITLATGEGQSFTGASTPGGVKGMQLYQCNQVNQALGSWRLEFGEGKLTFKKCWMLVRYYLK